MTLKTLFNQILSYIFPIKENINPSTDKIREILTAAGYSPMMMDGTYSRYGIETFKNSLKEDTISELKYIRSVYDCDDFAFATYAAIRAENLGIPYGVVIGVNKRGIMHAWNIFIDSTDELWFVEPQTDEIFKKTIEKVKYIII